MTYVRMKRRRCESAGIESRHVALPATSTTQDVVDAVTALSDDPGVHGILVQHPVGPHIDERARSKRSNRPRTSTGSPCTRSRR